MQMENVPRSGEVRSVQASQPMEEALGFLFCAALANSAPFTFSLRLIQARRKPMAPFPMRACERRGDPRSQRHSVTLCSDGIIAIKRMAAAGVVARSQSAAISSSEDFAANALTTCPRLAIERTRLVARSCAVNQRETYSGIIGSDPCAAFRLARKNSRRRSARSTIAGGSAVERVNFFVAIQLRDKTHASFGTKEIVHINWRTDMILQRPNIVATPPKCAQRDGLQPRARLAAPMAERPASLAKYSAAAVSYPCAS